MNPNAVWQPAGDAGDLTPANQFRTMLNNNVMTFVQAGARVDNYPSCTVCMSSQKCGLANIDVKTTDGRENDNN